MPRVRTCRCRSSQLNVAAATGRAPAQRVGDRRVAVPAHRERGGGAGGVAALGGGEREGGGAGELLREARQGGGPNELPKRAFEAQAEGVIKAHGGGGSAAASKHSPLASKQAPVVNAGMQNKLMDSRHGIE